MSILLLGGSLTYATINIRKKLGPITIRAIEPYVSPKKTVPCCGLAWFPLEHDSGFGSAEGIARWLLTALHHGLVATVLGCGLLGESMRLVKAGLLINLTTGDLPEIWELIVGSRPFFHCCNLRRLGKSLCQGAGLGLATHHIISTTSSIIFILEDALEGDLLVSVCLGGIALLGPAALSAIALKTAQNTADMSPFVDLSFQVINLFINYVMRVLAWNQTFEVLATDAFRRAIWYSFQVWNVYVVYATAAQLFKDVLKYTWEFSGVGQKSYPIEIESLRRSE